MRLADIKQRLVTEFFSAQGEGVVEDNLQDHLKPAIDLISVESIDLSEMQEHDEYKDAYSMLSKTRISIGLIFENDQVLYGCVRQGKAAASINFTSPTQTPRFCSLTEIKDAFKEAAALNRCVTFKTVNIK